MTELATQHDTTADTTTPSTGETGLIRWAMEARAAHQIAQSLAKTSFVPRVMQGRADEVTAAILTGTELGFDPMTSLRCINIIDGTPALTALALRGLVQSAGHEVWVVESTDTRAVVSGQRLNSTRIETSTWTMDRARKAGLATKRNWQTQPQNMLIARATADVCRRVAADLLIGMPYTIEELTDELPQLLSDPSDTPRSARAATRRRQRTPLPPSDPPPEPATDAQLDELSTLYPALNGGSETRFDYAARVLGRHVDTLASLTAAEAQQLIAAINQDIRTEVFSTPEDTPTPTGDDGWPDVATPPPDHD